jgi:CheY-like chemotaxis protein
VFKEGGPAMADSSVVLVVEDEPLVRYRIANEFELAGWEVLHAGSGERALHMLEIHGDRITAVFTDIDLGGQISGWDVADAFRAAYPRKRIVYASGQNVDAQRILCDSRFFRKPYSCQVVLDACGDKATTMPLKYS